MAQTSVHIKAAKSGALEHNERTRKMDHVRADLTPNNQNWHASDYAGNADLLAEIKADYQAAHGKKLHAKATPVREGVVVIQKDTTMKQLLAAARRCDEEFGIQVKAVSIHMDEGHYEDGPTPMQNGPWVGNYHAHHLQAEPGRYRTDAGYLRRSPGHGTGHLQHQERAFRNPVQGEEDAGEAGCP